MSIEQFFNIYQPLSGKYGHLEIRVRQDPMFIHLDGGKYSNNKHWKRQVFLVSRAWEYLAGTTLPEGQEVPREWWLLANDLKTPPDLSEAQKDEVKEMLRHSQDTEHWRDKKSAGLDFDQTSPIGM